MPSSHPIAGDHLRYVRCNLCGADAGDRLRSDGPLHLVRCRQCGLVYVTPRLDQRTIQALYDEDYFATGNGARRGYRDYLADRESYLLTFRRRMRWLERRAGNGRRLLDVGCAAGFFLEVCRASGWDAWGVDPAACMVAYAQSKLQLPVFCGTLRERRFEPGSFDVVTLWDVLEHMTDPRRELLEVNRVLEPGGLLVVETQNIDSWVPKVLGKRWIHYGNDLHLFHFTPGTLTRLLEETGFAVKSITRADAGKVCTLRFVADKLAHLNKVAARLANALLARWPGYATRSVYVNLGDEMIVCAQKSREA
jgi:SAM-dependent methyltransferase